jgi:hypothetical protein
MTQNNEKKEGSKEGRKTREIKLTKEAGKEGRKVK